MNFNNITWKSDRLEVNDLVFSLGQFKPENWDNGNECFVLWKDKKLVDQYTDYFRHFDGKIVNMMELGMWDGGSTAFWYEMIRPRRIVGLDYLEEKKSEYFSKWREQEEKNRNASIRTFWNTNQSDRKRIREIIQAEFNNEPLDLVIDDASHQYQPTRNSFEIIFPLLQPGALYIIEDWAWLHWKEWAGSFEPGQDLTRFVNELIQSTGSYSGIISNVNVYPGFTVVKRGPEPLDAATDFTLGNHTFTHKYKPSILKSVKKVLKG